MKKIILVGGYLINNNYGDFIQAKIWVDYYNKKGGDVTIIYAKEGAKALSVSFPKVKLIDINDLSELLVPAEEYIIHMYGGGYLNLKFGEEFLKIFRFVNIKGAKLIVTGVQVESVFAKRLKTLLTRKVFKRIEWLSFRDKSSKKLLGDINSMICDDSFGYFSTKIGNRNLYMHTIVSKTKILLQLSLNAYMYRDKVYSEYLVKLKRLVARIGQEGEIDFVTSFDKPINGVIEGDSLMIELGIKSGNKVFRSEEIDKWSIGGIGYKFAIVNSFHTYILLKFKLDCPVYFISMSGYYDQKSEALKEYKLLDDDFLINSLDKVDNFRFNIEKNDNSDKSFSKMFTKFKRLVGKVEEALR